MCANVFCHLCLDQPETCRYSVRPFRLDPESGRLTTEEEEEAFVKYGRGRIGGWWTLAEP